MKPLRHLGVPTPGVSVLSVLSGSHTPWWAMVAVAVVGIAYAALARVFPQDSTDRRQILQYWLDHHADRDQPAARGRPDHPPRPVPRRVELHHPAPARHPRRPSPPARPSVPSPTRAHFRRDAGHPPPPDKPGPPRPRPPHRRHPRLTRRPPAQATAPAPQAHHREHHLGHPPRPARPVLLTDRLPLPHRREPDESPDQTGPPPPRGPRPPPRADSRPPDRPQRPRQLRHARDIPGQRARHDPLIHRQAPRNTGAPTDTHQWGLLASAGVAVTVAVKRLGHRHRLSHQSGIALAPVFVRVGYR